MIQKELVKPINMAEPIRIADPTLLINDFRNENKEDIALMKFEHEKDMEALLAQIEDMKLQQIAFFKRVKGIK
jgi:hypothetical protein